MQTSTTSLSKLAPSGARQTSHSHVHVRLHSGSRAKPVATPRARGANHRQAQLLCADARYASRQSQPTRTRASFSRADDGSVARRWDGESGGGLRRRQNRHLLFLLSLFSLRSSCRLFDEDEEEEDEEDDDFCARGNDADASSSSSASEVETVDDDIDRSFLCVSTSMHPLCVSHAQLDVVFRPSPSSRVVVVVVMVVYRVSSTSIVVCTNESVFDNLPIVHRPTDSACVRASTPQRTRRRQRR